LYAQIKWDESAKSFAKKYEDWDVIVSWVPVKPIYQGFLPTFVSSASCTLLYYVKGGTLSAGGNMNFITQKNPIMSFVDQSKGYLL